MSHAVDPSATPPMAASHLEPRELRRLPVAQAVALIAALAASSWLVVGAAIVWLVG